jgi:nitrogen fixation NifU-like protein
MSDLRELYQEVIFDHNRSPRNFHPMENADHVAEGHNPLCGDQLTVYLRIEDGKVADASFVGHGCAISTASASLMTEAVKGRRLADVQHLFESVHDMLTRHDAPVPTDLGKLAALSGVREYPARVKCASLCWHTLNAALADQAAPVTTE